MPLVSAVASIARSRIVCESLIQIEPREDVSVRASQANVAVFSGVGRAKRPPRPLQHPVGLLVEKDSKRKTMQSGCVKRRWEGIGKPERVAKQRSGGFGPAMGDRRSRPQPWYTTTAARQEVSSSMGEALRRKASERNRVGLGERPKRIDWSGEKPGAGAKIGVVPDPPFRVKHAWRFESLERRCLQKMCRVRKRRSSRVSDKGAGSRRSIVRDLKERGWRGASARRSHGSGLAANDERWRS